MTAFVEECRREWERLGVPDLLADEMAAELESDLAEAEADGVSVTEMLGESDPRRFAATWATERGLVTEPPPKQSRKRLWIWVALGFVLFVVLMSALAFGLFATTSVTSSPPSPQVSGIPLEPARVRVPNLVGLKACTAERTASDAGLDAGHVPHGRCDAVVVAQMPAAGTAVRRHATLALRLRG